MRLEQKRLQDRMAELEAENATLLTEMLRKPGEGDKKALSPEPGAMPKSDFEPGAPIEEGSFPSLAEITTRFQNTVVQQLPALVKQYQRKFQKRMLRVVNASMEECWKRSIVTIRQQAVEATKAVIRQLPKEEKMSSGYAIQAYQLFLRSMGSVCFPLRGVAEAVWALKTVGPALTPQGESEEEWRTRTIKYLLEWLEVCWLLLLTQESQARPLFDVDGADSPADAFSIRNDANLQPLETLLIYPALVTSSAVLMKGQVRRKIQ
jgi:uncharacterized FlaG/YvyC family protein